MSDNNPTSPANQKDDSFLGRLFVVVFYSVVTGAIVAAIMLTKPGSIDSDPQRRFGDSIIKYTQLGWMFFLTIVYLAGRFSELLVAGRKALGERKPKIERPMAFIDAMGFWMLPSLAFIFSGGCFWILWRIPDAIKWVAEFFRG
jgi:hypothetical protein